MRAKKSKGIHSFPYAEDDKTANELISACSELDVQKKENIRFLSLNTEKIYLMRQKSKKTCNIISALLGDEKNDFCVVTTRTKTYNTEVSYTINLDITISELVKLKHLKDASGAFYLTSGTEIDDNKLFHNYRTYLHFINAPGAGFNKQTEYRLINRQALLDDGISIEEFERTLLDSDPMFVANSVPVPEGYLTKYTLPLGNKILATVNYYKNL